MGLHDYSDEPAPLNDEKDSHHAEEVKKLKSALQLVQRFISLEKDNPSELEIEFHKFKKLIEEDYLAHTLKDDFINEAQTYQEFLSIIDKLEEIVNYHFLANKTVIGVGGGFSAGKSSFINSLLGYDFLPVDTTPTTSIPTYITKGKEKKIEVRTISDVIVQLDENDFKSISHKITGDTGFNLAGLINSSVVFTDYVKYENIVLLDTPGYTKSDYYKKTDKTDVYIAKKQLEKTDALFWLIEIENGTIKHDDIEFIKRMKYDKPKYFIFNKADKKTEYDIHQILNQVHDTLSSKQINYEGIIAYSSYKKKTYAHKGKTISEYLDEMDRLSFRDYNELHERLEKIFKDYEAYYSEKENNEKKQLSILNKVSLYIEDDLMETLDELTNKSKKMVPYYQQLSRDMKTLEEKIMSQFDVIFKNIQENPSISLRSSKKGSDANTGSRETLIQLLKEQGQINNLIYNDFPKYQTYNQSDYNLKQTSGKVDEKYSIGSKGPVGGRIFHKEEMDENGNELNFEALNEIALSKLVFPYKFGYVKSDNCVTSKGIGFGYANTTILSENNIFIAMTLKNLYFNNHNDFFLPSLLEMEKLYYFLKTASNIYFPLFNGVYWTSSMINRNTAYAFDMDTGRVIEESVEKEHKIFPARMFTFKR